LRHAATGKGDRAAARQLSYAQQRLWFLHQYEPAASGYNIPTAMRLSGRMSVAALAQVIAEVERRHEALRTRFGTVDGRPVQVIAARPSGGGEMVEGSGGG